jgi:hypothetical protein
METMETILITCETFKKRIADLCLKSGLTGFPTKRRDQMILLKSIAISFNENKTYTEAEVNQIIKGWLTRMSGFFDWDHFMLRRVLVDEGFLTRNQDGSCYRLSPSGSLASGVTFDPEINGLDVLEVISEAQQLIAQRKAEYLQNHTEPV